jgi:hypothetical protein
MPTEAPDLSNRTRVRVALEPPFELDPVTVEMLNHDTVFEIRRPSAWAEISMWKGARDVQQNGIKNSRLCQNAMMTGLDPAQASAVASWLMSVQRLETQTTHR